ncbi:FAD-binding protein [Chachezhania antarctica]|uniref:FAD-binding protein n=1 Tax=Chachezhania antarctica TaxID=2340860 RepID=UPI000EAD5C6B|nr:FAD-binding protein [Chachezhania antarctica]
MRPGTEAELAEAVATAQGPLAIVGGGTRGVRPETGEVIETGGLSGITLYEPGALTLVVQAGTAVAEVETALAAEGQRLAFEPMDHRGLLGTVGAPTIGGVIAANVSGPRRIQAGAARDFALGVRFVDGTGTVIRNGGRVMKNVTGYDLVKLTAGSWGSLGVLTEVALKVLPAPAAQGSVVLTGLSTERAVAAMSRTLGSPFEVTGAAHLPEGPDGAPVTMIRVEGFEEQVRYRTGRLQALLEGFGAAHVALDTAADWAAIRDVKPFHEAAGDVWRVSCKPSDAPALAEKAGASGLIFDWGGGLIWVLMPKGTDLRTRLGDFGGHATLVRAAPETRAQLGTFQSEPAPVAALTAGLRARFDPKGLFNPGLMARAA